MTGIKECEVCGKEATERAYIPLWHYGKREVKERNVCKSCLSAHKKGVL